MFYPFRSWQILVRTSSTKTLATSPRVVLFGSQRHKIGHISEVSGRPTGMWWTGCSSSISVFELVLSMVQGTPAIPPAIPPSTMSAPAPATIHSNASAVDRSNPVSTASILLDRKPWKAVKAVKHLALTCLLACLYLLQRQSCRS